MAIRVLFLVVAAIIIINLVLLSVGAIFGVNLYKKYGKHILIFILGIILFVVALYIVFAILGLM